MEKQKIEDYIKLFEKYQGYPPQALSAQQKKSISEAEKYFLNKGWMDIDGFWIHKNIPEWVQKLPGFIDT